MVTSIIILSIIGLVSATLLYVISRKFHVEEDPRIDEIEAVLPGANCGGCGFAGCRNFAEQCAKATSLDNLLCPVGGNAVMQKIAPIVGMEAVEQAPRIAVVRCNGSCENRPQTSHYEGAHSCAVEAALYSGESNCNYGCLGEGDCAAACDFGGITMDPVTHLPIVDPDICIACGSCVKACPRNIIELRKRQEPRVYVACNNRDKGIIARKVCSAACIGCGKCAKSCPNGAITLADNLAYIDDSLCLSCQACVEGCPTHAIHVVGIAEKNSTINEKESALC
ncbi:RnfABCDGE type electron transport complex subunit B [Barnesiella viscericola]|uniref:RnfABCDGE type electron transport complex subunit B n=1 Tax=Barnesiella viscericola TaxID=397865 RepID=UPI002357982A|nr:RnfABCDGE type electron transport complex subunit B [Barnesiella viscericola]